MNNSYRDALEESGLRFSGLSPDERLVEMIELPGHPYFIGCQFHPEFKSAPLCTASLVSRVHRRRQKGERGVVFLMRLSCRPCGMRPGKDKNMTKTKVVKIGDVAFGERGSICVIAGPCLIESEELTRKCAEKVKQTINECGIGGVFKASYDKANRSSGKSPRGPGIDEGLKYSRW